MKTKNKKYAILVAYRGLDFHGFQAQPQFKTVESCLRKALSNALHIEPRQFVPAGRTDAGVHAVGQVVSFRAASQIPVSDWPHLLNAQAARGIWILGAAEVSADFHARARAQGRCYRYLLRDGCALRGDSCDPHWAWALAPRLDLHQMRLAARSFIGQHDFSAYGFRLNPQKSARCGVEHIQIRRRAGCVVMDIRGDRFLRRMVRLMVAHLVEVGRGLQQAKAIARALATGEAALQESMAPARGLYLRRVYYARDDFLSAQALLPRPASSDDKALSNSVTLAEICALMRRS